MRGLLVATLSLVMPAFATRTDAQNYPWCSNFADGAGTNCGYSTQAQCLAAAMGSGGICEQNNTYRPPIAGTPTGHRALRQRTQKRAKA